MSEIKFRAWCNTEKKMFFLNPEDAYLEDEDKQPVISCLVSDDDWRVMQYTGLKDKSGKEIYEGDIVRTGQIDSVHNPGEWRRPGEFENAAFVVDGDLMRDTEKYRLEVIGNVYEIPEI